MDDLLDFMGEQQLVEKIKRMDREVAATKRIVATKEQDMLDAAMKGRMVALELALADGAKINEADLRSGRTALMCAAENFHVEAVILLLTKGADVTMRDKNGATALSYAAKSRTFEEDGAVHVNALATLQTLCEAGSDLQNADCEGWTPLHEAARAGQAELVTELLSRGANMDRADLSGFTPLCWAAKYGQNNAVRALLAAGVQVNAHNTAGLTPLQLARDSEMEETVRLLEEAGASDATHPSPSKNVWAIARQRSKVEMGISTAVRLSRWAAKSKKVVHDHDTTPAKAAAPAVAAAPAAAQAAAPAAASASPHAALDLVAYMDKVHAACGMAGFSITFTYPTGGGGHGSATLRSPTLAQLSTLAAAVRTTSPDTFSEFVAGTGDALKEAEAARLSEEEERQAAVAMLAMTRQKARAARAVEDAEFDLEEAELACSMAAKAAASAPAGSERAAVAADEVRQKQNWRDGRKAALEGARAMLKAATNL